MSGEVLLELAQWAGQTVAAAALTDTWESVRGRVARLLGHGDARQSELAERRLAQTREQLMAAEPGAAAQVRQEAAGEWTVRFKDLLEEDPSAEAELRAMVEEITAALPAGGTVQALGHAVAAGRDVRVSASGGSVAAGVIHGNVGAPGPTPPGPVIP